MDKKNIIIICLCVALAVVSWIAFQPTPVPYDKELIDAEMRRLNGENDSLTKHIAKQNDLNLKDKKTIDSLQHLKPKIIVQYDTIYQKIDRINANGLVNQFGSIFSNANIK